MKNKQALFPLTPASAYLSVGFFTCQKRRHHHIRGKALAGGAPGKSPAASEVPSHHTCKDSALDEDKLDTGSRRAQGPLGSPQISEPAPDGGGAWLDLHDPVMDHVLLRITFASSEENFLLPAP